MGSVTPNNSFPAQTVWHSDSVLALKVVVQGLNPVAEKYFYACYRKGLQKRRRLQRQYTFTGCKIQLKLYF